MVIALLFTCPNYKVTFRHINSFQIYIHIFIIQLRLQIIIEAAILDPQGSVYIPLLQFNPRSRHDACVQADF